MRADSTKTRPLAANRAFRACAGLLFAVALAAPARAQYDPYKLRMRGLTDVPYPSYQGDRCTSIDAPRAAVWGVLTSPDQAAAWLLADLDVIPLSSRLKKGDALTKGAVLVLSVDTKEGPRTIEITVLAAVENQLLSLAVTKDDDVMTAGAANLIYTYLLEEPQRGRTDLYWATHYDSDSPLAAAVSGLKIGSKKRFVERVERGLMVLWGKSEAAAALENAPPPPPAVRAATPTPRPTPAKKKKRK